MAVEPHPRMSRTAIAYLTPRYHFRSNGGTPLLARKTL
jgi:hypothetical protein